MPVGYGPDNQTITITLASLGNNAVKQGAVVDNAAPLFNDILVQVQVKVGSGSPSASGYIDVYAYGTVDNGSTHSGDATDGTDATLSTFRTENNKLIGSFIANAASTTFKSPLLSVRRAFNNNIPKKWGIIVVNKTGVALTSTGSDHYAIYQGIA